VTELTPDEKAELRKAAEAATPGPWRREMIALAPGYMTIGVGTTELPVCIMNGVVESPRGNRDATYVAMASPSTVLALLDENARLEVEVGSLKARVPPEPPTFCMYCRVSPVRWSEGRCLDCGEPSK